MAPCAGCILFLLGCLHQLHQMRSPKPCLAANVAICTTSLTKGSAASASWPRLLLARMKQVSSICEHMMGLRFGGTWPCCLQSSMSWECTKFSSTRSCSRAVGSWPGSHQRKSCSKTRKSVSGAHRLSRMNGNTKSYVTPDHNLRKGLRQLFVSRTGFGMKRENTLSTLMPWPTLTWLISLVVAPPFHK